MHRIRFARDSEGIVQTYSSLVYNHIISWKSKSIFIMYYIVIMSRGRRFSLYKLHSSCIVHVMMKTNDLRVCSCFILMLLFCSNKIVAGECRAWQCCNRPAAHDNDIIIILYSTGSPADGTTRRYCCVSSQHCAVHLC